MDAALKQNIRDIAEPFYAQTDDPSHDFSHIERVVHNAEVIQAKEGGDIDIITAACYFHDSVKYLKSDVRYPRALQESADRAERELKHIPGFPKEKISAVKRCIMEHSYTKGVIPETLESKIVQDADRLEATGVCGIARTLMSTGYIPGSKLYHNDDPYAENRELQPNIALDFMFSRLFVIPSQMNTKTGKAIAETNEDIMYAFMDQLEQEIGKPRPEKFKRKKKLETY
jgi:uncharacterized protein